MSRRKQSAPCKVQGPEVVPLQLKKNTSLDIVRLHTLTDSLLDGKDFHCASNGSLEEETVIDYSVKAKPNVEVNPRNDQFSLEEKDSRSIPDEEILDLSLSATRETTGKFFANFQPNLNSAPGAGGTHSSAKRKLSEEQTREGASRKVLIISNKDDRIASSNVEKAARRRNLSTEETLACPICNKTFMSKHALLTHSEVHNSLDFQCSVCKSSFPSLSAFTVHQKTVHGQTGTRNSVLPTNSLLQRSPGKSVSSAKEYKAVSGFDDLAFIDFTCEKFTTISADLCSKQLYRLTERDKRHFFLCKKCDLLFPTLSSLKLHVMNNHVSSDEKAKFDVKAQDLIIDHSNKSLENGGSARKKKTSKTSFAPEFEKVFKALDLVPKTSKKTKAPVIVYGMEDDVVKTSPMLSHLEVPKWMRNNEATGEQFDLFNVDLKKSSEEERPSLKLKLVRRRGEGEENVIQNKDYFIYDEPGTIESKEKAMETYEDIPKVPSNTHEKGSFSCRNCGKQFTTEESLGVHNTSSACGVGVRTSASGKKVYWCRLCQYSSFEKSTILRHQRTHTGVRPYTCKFCNLAFTTKANCERHIKKRHRSGITTDADVKNAVYCDFELLKKARDGEIYVATASKNCGNRLIGSRNTASSNSANANGRIAAVQSVQRNNEKHHPHRIEKTHRHAGKDHSTPKTTYSGNFAEKRTSHIFQEPSQHHRNESHKEAGVAKASSKLIPLFKIQVYNQASKMMFKRFQKDYSEAVSIVAKSQSPEELMSKVVSLLGSTSSALHQTSPSKRKSTSVFTPMDSLLPDSMFQSPSKRNKENSPERGSDSFVSMDVAEDACFGEDAYSDSQMLTGSNLNEDFSFNGNSELSDSPRIESPFKPLKSSSTSALPLRAYAANEPSQSNTEKSILTNTPAKYSLSRSVPSSGSGLRGKYRMIAAKPKALSNGDNVALTWKFIPQPPRTRDERGRYVRDPDAPAQPARTSRPFQPITPKDGSDDRPTMVSMKAGRFHFGVNRRSIAGFSSKKFLPKASKCPKCEKVFPWASSLRRHIMTHTGYKPYMCSFCSFRFTTRSNLLRHAYRRHGLERGTEEHNNALVILSVDEQKKFAEKEAQKIAEMDEATAAAELNLEQDELLDAEESTSGMLNSPATTSSTGASYRQDAHHNKRYICGLCKFPFANRSNVVRHLYRLHKITKDHPKFREFLVKIRKKTFPLGPRDPERMEEEFAPVENDMQVVPYSSSPKLTTLESNPPTLPPPTPLEEENSIPPSSPPPVAPLPVIKPFTCGICSIGFTKRNNAARHIKHQHNIPRGSERMRSLIIRNNTKPIFVEPVGEDTQPTVDVVENELSTSFSPPPLDPEPLEELTTPAEPIDVPEVPSSPLEEPSYPDVSLMDENAVEENAEEDTPIPPVDLSSVKKEPSETFDEEQEEQEVGAVEEPNKSENVSWRSKRRSSYQQKEEDESTISATGDISMQSRRKNIRFTQFVCGVCKRIFKTVDELKVHLIDHNIPHPWHCPVCDVPFTNKYNCQRHLQRRHGVGSGEPKYVEDVCHGPRSPKKRSKTYGR